VQVYEVSRDGENAWASKWAAQEIAPFATLAAAAPEACAWFNGMHFVRSAWALQEMLQLSAKCIGLGAR
jgi:hypothetical protein